MAALGIVVLLCAKVSRRSAARTRADASRAGTVFDRELAEWMAPVVSVNSLCGLGGTGWRRDNG